MAAVDVFLYPGEANPNDVLLADPTVTRGGASSGPVTVSPGTGDVQYTGFAPTISVLPPPASIPYEHKVRFRGFNRVGV